MSFKNKKHSEKTKEIIRQKSIGHPVSKITRNKIRIAQSGEKSNNWKGGHTSRYLRKTAPRPQPDECELCGSMDVICLDHNHTTNKFRGWICRRCNIVLGMVKDNKETLKSMIEYLKRNG